MKPINPDHLYRQDIYFDHVENSPIMSYRRFYKIFSPGDRQVIQRHQLEKWCQSLISKYSLGLVIQIKTKKKHKLLVNIQSKYIKIVYQKKINNYSRLIYNVETGVGYSDNQLVTLDDWVSTLAIITKKVQIHNIVIWKVEEAEK
ncbi:hypothetical protein DID75_01490 [Candidatus Marinamargulisbacteria bacterium SCGC AG-410-N11]|nr:hypothetical protein DID75_01490 [Candidatus Marinamargulisbacteria bacterium SCGC AG-410-N11]